MRGALKLRRTWSLITIVVLVAGSATVGVANATGRVAAAGEDGEDGCSGTPAEGDPIELGSIITLSADFAQFKDLAAGLKAAVSCINASGGADGVPLDLEICDDEGDPAAARQCALDLRDKVAVIGNETATGAPEILPVLEEAGVPYIGGVPVDPIEYTSPVSFPLTGGIAGLFPALAKHLGTSGTERVAVVTCDIAACAEGAELFRTFFEQQGGEETKVVQAGLEEADYGPAIVAATSDFDPEALVFLFTAQQCPLLMRAVEATLGSDNDVQQWYPVDCATPPVFDAVGDAADGTYFVSEVKAAQVKRNRRKDPGVRLYREAMAEYQPRYEDWVVAQQGFLVPYFIRDLVQEIGVENATSGAILETMPTLQDFPLQGTHSYTFDPESESQQFLSQLANPYAQMIRYRDGKFRAESGLISGFE